MFTVPGRGTKKSRRKAIYEYFWLYFIKSSSLREKDSWTQPKYLEEAPKRKGFPWNWKEDPHGHPQGERDREWSAFPEEDTRSWELTLKELHKRWPRAGLAKESHEVMILAYRHIVGAECCPASLLCPGDYLAPPTINQTAPQVGTATGSHSCGSHLEKPFFLCIWTQKDKNCHYKTRFCWRIEPTQKENGSKRWRRRNWVLKTEPGSN